MQISSYLADLSVCIEFLFFFFSWHLIAVMTHSMCLESLADVVTLCHLFWEYTCVVVKKSTVCLKKSSQVHSLTAQINRSHL